MMKKIGFLISFFILGCNGNIDTGRREFHDSCKEISGKDWVFCVPAIGWWSIQTGKNSVILLGGSRNNIGSRPLNVKLEQTCSDHLKYEEKFKIGEASKWLTGRVGHLYAYQNKESILYVCEIPLKEKCNLILECEGDVTRSSLVKEQCDHIISSLVVK